MKLYFIYAKIPQNIYDKRLKYIISNQYDFRSKHGYMFGLYAWSKKKKLCKEFIDTRKGDDIYTVVEKEDIIEREYKMIREKYYELELKECEYLYHSDEDDEEGKYMKVVSTKNEYNIVTNDFAEYLNDFGPVVSDGSPHPLIFSDKLINYLDIVGYTTNYFIKYGTEEEVEIAVDLHHQHKNFFGHKLYQLGDEELTTLLYLFKFMFFGDNEKAEVEEGV